MMVKKYNNTQIFTYYIGLVRDASFFFSVQTQACFIVTPKSKPQGLSIGNQSISSQTVSPHLSIIVEAAWLQSQSERTTACQFAAKKGNNYF